MSEIIEKVCFTVDGGWLADFARTRLEEGDWDRGLALLTDTLDGMTVDQALSILKGKATLTGDSSSGIDIEVLPEGNPIELQITKRLDYLYGNLFRHGSFVYEPYAIVSGWCRDDHNFALTYQGTSNFVGTDHGIGAFRSFFYAKNKADDLLVRLSKAIIVESARPAEDVLCEKVSKPVPFWYSLPTNDVVNTLEKWLKTHSLPVVGAFEEGMSFSAQNSDVSDSRLEDTAEAVERVVHPVVFDDEASKNLSEAENTRLAIDMLKLTTGLLAESPDLEAIYKIDAQFERSVKALHRYFSNDGWDAIAELRTRLRAMTEERLSKKICDQAEVNGGFIELKLTVHKDGNDVPYQPCQMLIVPKNPFVLWCLRHFDYEAHGKERPVWNKIAGSGLKMYNDDPYHSDWMIGAGVPLDATYDHDEDSFGAVVRSCAYSKMSDITAEYTGHAFTVLAKSNISWYSGKIVHAEPGKGVPPGSIVVVPSAGPDYQLAMETASKTGDYGPGCIICETGGKLAHLSIVGREMNCLVLMLPNACTMYRDGEHVFIDVEAGTITSHI